MAIDVYLQIDGIKGESADSNHQGWIELTSASWGVIQPRSATASTAGGHTAERCEHRSRQRCDGQTDRHLPLASVGDIDPVQRYRHPWREAVGRPR